MQMSLSRESVVWYQKPDKDCRSIAHRLRHGKWPRFTPVSLRRETIDEFSLQDGVLVRSRSASAAPVIVWPAAKRFELLHNHHVITAAHCGASKMYEVLGRRAWFPGMKRLCSEEYPTYAVVADAVVRKVLGHRTLLSYRKKRIIQMLSKW